MTNSSNDKPNSSVPPTVPPDSKTPAPPPGWMPAPPPPDLVPDRSSNLSRVVKKLNPIVQKTKIDLDACRQVASRMISDQEVKVKEQIAARASEPVELKIPVENYRPATACDSLWMNMPNNGEKYRMCGGCNSFVYDFADLDAEEAQSLVFKREGISKPCFYQRSDGRYLTRDCPVGVQRGRTTLALIVVGALAVVGAIALAVLMPHPKPAPTVQAEIPTDTIKVPAKVSPQLSEPLPSRDSLMQADMQSFPAEQHAPQEAAPLKLDEKSPSGQYVTVPIEVLEKLEKGENPSAAPAAAPPQPDATQIPAPFPQPSAATAPAAQPSVPAALPLPPDLAAPPVQSQPPEAPAKPGNPYVKTY
jgi:hypothetical protein